MTNCHRLCNTLSHEQGAPKLEVEHSTSISLEQDMQMTATQST